MKKLKMFAEVVACILHNAQEKGMKRFTVSEIARQYQLGHRKVQKVVDELQQLGYIEIEYSNGMTVYRLVGKERGGR